MRRYCMIGVALMTLSSSVRAGISVRPVFGYGFGVGKSEAGTDCEEDTNGDQVKNRVTYYSAGQGLKVGLGVDFDFLEGVGVGIDGGYSMGTETEIAKSKEYWPFDSSWNTSSIKMKTSYVYCSPSVRIERSILGITPFCGFGLTFALSPKTQGSMKDVATTTEEHEMEITYGLGMGTCAVMGVKYPLLGKVGLIAEVRLDQLALKAKHSEITKYTEDGEDKLGELSTREREIEFKEDDTEDDSTDDTKPTIYCTSTIPANSISINIGAVVSF